MRFIAPGEENFWVAPETSPAPDRFLIIGGDSVIHRGEQIHIGSCAFQIEEVEEHALNGADLPLGDRRLLQAAMALLVIAVAKP